MLPAAGDGVGDLAQQGGIHQGLLVLTAAKHGCAAVPWLGGQVDVTGAVPALGVIGTETGGTRYHVAEDQHLHRADVGV